ncbi:bifunctional hydroxymethylpyrimidine kinase/phosphomethylpyrimidine kinase [Paracoccus seriniphilus]|uniref:hydroxymethylpyrimidine kinase n=1 Tax=Paracoccus seriniphilus TaxID=184748 RepID=A0A239PWI0_9RHOB|nr:bifunctional hydroxymethylpyrimidine kinase/phosphomethylpyrimidine kinase [Paracoccus seriniphilus]WCR13381.1 bifunctional hydroxymethylpyrimidine kinase/phosphomethylpyrimidine kinase [Paracoccus seriniphilus]SNT74373.1 hydroxymethylpyrimidine kinase /phosphomethylpyrimidine kinase [Paracoccus seriniphilus]
MKGSARLLIIAGSDSGGGAGIQADIKTASALGVYAATAITAITAQNTQGVQAAQAVSPEMVARQIRSVLDDIGADAVKIGMLGSARIVQTVATELRDFDGPVVLDPVMVAKSGDRLLESDAICALIGQLLPRATLLTPNLPEAAQLLDQPSARSANQICEQGAALKRLGARAVLMKGGHSPDADCTDWLISDEPPQHFTSPRLATSNTHGTGCSLSSAIAAGLSKGASLGEAVHDAHHWLHRAIAQADGLQIGKGHGPVHHFHEVWA